MNTYVLVKGRNVEAGWYELIDKKEEDTIERLASRFSKNMATQFLNGRKGLDHEVMNNFLWRYIENLQQYLKEGKTLLINRVGGMMFMGEGITVLKTTKDKYFPTTKEHVGLSGWLTPNGEFHKCEHGEHWQFAKEELKKEKVKLLNEQYVSMGSVGYDVDKTSHLFVPFNSFTEKQEKWFQANYYYLDKEQKRIYDETKTNQIF